MRTEPIGPLLRRAVNAQLKSWWLQSQIRLQRGRIREDSWAQAARPPEGLAGVALLFWRELNLRGDDTAKSAHCSQDGFAAVCWHYSIEVSV